MNNIINVTTDDDAWIACGFDAAAVSEEVFAAVLSYVGTHEETGFLNTGKKICVNLSLSDDAEIRRLNREFRGLDKPTNVLSFANIDDEDFGDYVKVSSEIELGDIIIAYETLSREAAEKKIPLRDHFSHLLIHGLLHLLGFDHQEDEEAEYMENFEIKILQQFNISNPYQE